MLVKFGIFLFWISSFLWSHHFDFIYSFEHLLGLQDFCKQAKIYNGTFL
jgi:hypothetical protein